MELEELIEQLETTLVRPLAPKGINRSRHDQMLMSEALPRLRELKAFQDLKQMPIHYICDGAFSDYEKHSVNIDLEAHLKERLADEIKQEILKDDQIYFSKRRQSGSTIIAGHLFIIPWQTQIKPKEGEEDGQT